MSIEHLLPELSKYVSSSVDGGNIGRDLAAFDQGYNAGWDDARKAVEHGSAEQRRELIDLLSRHTSAAQDARTAVLADLRPIITSIADILVPQIADQSFGPHLAQFVFDQINTYQPPNVVITVNQADFDSVQAALQHTDFAGCTVQIDPAIRPQQACVGYAGSEVEFNFQDAKTEIQTALASFLSQSITKDASHE